MASPHPLHPPRQSRRRTSHLEIRVPMETVGQGPRWVVGDPSTANSPDVARGERVPQTCRHTHRAFAPQDAAWCPSPCPPPAKLTNPAVTKRAQSACSVTFFPQRGPPSSRHLPCPRTRSPGSLLPYATLHRAYYGDSGHWAALPAVWPTEATLPAGAAWGLGLGPAPRTRLDTLGPVAPWLASVCPSGVSRLLVFWTLHWILLLNFLCSQEVSKNLTKENKQIRDEVEGIRTEMNKQGGENCSRDVRSAVQRDAAAAYAHPQVQPRPPHPARPAPGSPGFSPGPGLPLPSSDPAVGHTVCASPSTYLRSPKRLSEGC